MVGEERELVVAVGVVGLEGIPQKGEVFLLAAGLEGERQVVAQCGGFLRGSRLRRCRFIFAPDAGEGCLGLFLEAGDQFPVGGNEGLLGFDLGTDGLLGREGGRGIFKSLRMP